MPVQKNGQNLVLKNLPKMLRVAGSRSFFSVWAVDLFHDIEIKGQNIYSICNLGRAGELKITLTARATCKTLKLDAVFGDMRIAFNSI